VGVCVKRHNHYLMQHLHSSQILVDKAPPGPLLLTNVSLTAVTLLIFSKMFLTLSHTREYSLLGNKDERKREKPENGKRKQKLNQF